MQSVLVRDADEAQADGLQDKASGPERVQPVLGLPAAIVAGREPERDPVTRKVPVGDTNEDADPVDKCDYDTSASGGGLAALGRLTGCILSDSEAVHAASTLGQLEPDWREGV